MSSKLALPGLTSVQRDSNGKSLFHETDRPRPPDLDSQTPRKYSRMVNLTLDPTGKMTWGKCKVVIKLYLETLISMSTQLT